WCIRRMDRRLDWPFCANVRDLGGLVTRHSSTRGEVARLPYPFPPAAISGVQVVNSPLISDRNWQAVSANEERERPYVRIARLSAAKRSPNGLRPAALDVIRSRLSG